jgi:hypothetical protein
MRRRGRSTMRSRRRVRSALRARQLQSASERCMLWSGASRAPAQGAHAVARGLGWQADELEAEILSKPRPLPQLREEFARRSISTPVQVVPCYAEAVAADLHTVKQRSAPLSVQ